MPKEQVRGPRERCQMPDAANRANRLDRAIADLLAQAPEVEAAAVVSFDGLPMAAALPVTMDEDRVAAMSAALLSLGERAAEGLGRGSLSQVYIEGEHGTVFLVSADDEAVLVAVASKGAKVGMMLYEVRRAAAAVADALRAEPASAVVQAPEMPVQPVPAAVTEPVPAAVVAPTVDSFAAQAYDTNPLESTTYQAAAELAWPAYEPSTTPAPAEQTPWA
jgi:uncharacterized protein